MFCENCGKEIPSTVKFCIYCGFPIKSEEEEQAKAPAIHKNELSQKPFIIITAISAVLAIGAGIVFYQNSQEHINNLIADFEYGEELPACGEQYVLTTMKSDKIFYGSDVNDESCYEYDSYGRLLYEDGFSWNGNPLLKQYYYDQEGRIEKELDYEYLEDTYEYQINEINYTYTENGTEAYTKREQIGKNDTENPSNSITTEYDQYGNEINSISEYNGEIVYTSQTTNEYSESGMLLTTSMITSIGYVNVEYQYDENGRLIRRNRDSDEQNMNREYSREYSYDEQGKLILETVYLFYEEPAMVSYQYDENGNLMEMYDSETGVETFYQYEKLEDYHHNKGI